MGESDTTADLEALATADTGVINRELDTVLQSLTQTIPEANLLSGLHRRERAAAALRKIVVEQPVDDLRFEPTVIQQRLHTVLDEEASRTYTTAGSKYGAGALSRQIIRHVTTCLLQFEPDPHLWSPTTTGTLAIYLTEEPLSEHRESVFELLRTVVDTTPNAVHSVLDELPVPSLARQTPDELVAQLKLFAALSETDPQHLLGQHDHLFQLLDAFLGEVPPAFQSESRKIASLVLYVLRRMAEEVQEPLTEDLELVCEYLTGGTALEAVAILRTIARNGDATAIVPYVDDCLGVLHKNQDTRTEVLVILEELVYDHPGQVAECLDHVVVCFDDKNVDVQILTAVVFAHVIEETPTAGVEHIPALISTFTDLPYPPESNGERKLQRFIAGMLANLAYAAPDDMAPHVDVLTEYLHPQTKVTNSVLAVLINLSLKSPAEVAPYVEGVMQLDVTSENVETAQVQLLTNLVLHGYTDVPAQHVTTLLDGIRGVDGEQQITRALVMLSEKHPDCFVLEQVASVVKNHDFETEEAKTNIATVHENIK